MTDSTLKYHVLRTSKYWWESIRPTNWTESEHLQQPYINCVNDVERDLAEAVANLIRSSKRV